MARLSFFGVLLACVLVCSWWMLPPGSGGARSGLQASQKSAGKKKDADYKDLLPRIAPTEPGEVLKTFRVKRGFRVDLVASEPLVDNPVALDIDENGRAYVVEYPEYNQYANPSFMGHGQIRLLTDSNGDGRYDKASVFVDKLDSPTAVACYDGGVFVGAVPDILFCKDTDGDGKADVIEKVFTGFARDKAGEAMLNSFRWGLDNRFHVQTSLAGGSIRLANSKENNAKTKTLNVRNHTFLFDPRTKAMDVSGGGGQHGMSMDDWGRTFVCSNSAPAHLVMYDSRYIARNPYLSAPAASVNILPGGRANTVYRVSPVEPWRALRTKLRSQKLVPGSDEGGKPAGFFTAATGITVYRGDAWGDEYRGNLLVGEVSGNLVFRAAVEPDGVGLVARRADPGKEFLASTDIWFRPVQFAHAPDGNLYVIDMYRELIEGAAFLPPQILKYMDVGAGLHRGRIYRIARADFKQPPLPRLGSASSAELVKLLEHDNGWHRDTASRLLYQRQDKSTVGSLEQLANKSKSPLGRVHALYALEGLGALTPAMVLAGLGDAEPRVREHALKLAEKFGDNPAIRTRLAGMASDKNLRVRYQLAFTLGNIAGEAPVRVLAELARAEGGNSWFRLAVLSSANERAGDLFRLLLNDGKFRSSVAGKDMLVTLATQIGAAGRRNELATVVKGIDTLPASEKALSQALVRGLVSKQSAKARALLQGISAGKADAILADLLKTARLTAVNGKIKTTDRTSAVRTLGLAPFAQVRGDFASFLHTQQPQPVQAAALETLALYDEPDVAVLVLDAWPGMSPKLRSTAAETLFARPAWIASFLDAVATDKVGRGDVDPARLQLLQSHPDTKLRARAAKLFGSTTLSRRADVVARYQKALELKGMAGRGKELFKKNCSACHRLEGVGNEVGADLSAIRNRGADAILLNILDPNREVLPKFLTYVLVTDTGRAVTGMITAESATSITLRRPDGTSETILRINIDELRSTGVSFMPEGLEKQVSPQDMADLLAYFNSIQ